MSEEKYGTIEVEFGETDVQNLVKLAERKLSGEIDKISLDLFKEKEYNEYEQLVKGIGEAYINNLLYETVKHYVESDEVQELLENENDDK